MKPHLATGKPPGLQVRMESLIRRLQNLMNPLVDHPLLLIKFSNPRVEGSKYLVEILSGGSGWGILGVSGDVFLDKGRAAHVEQLAPVRQFEFVRRHVPPTTVAQITLPIEGCQRSCFIEACLMCHLHFQP